MSEQLLNFFGDLCLEGVSKEHFVYGKKLLAEMEKGINIGNLECALTDAIEEKPMQAHILHCVPENALAYLENFRIVSLANNHIQDFFNKGIEDTKARLDKAGILYFGIGHNFKEALTPLQTNLDGLKIAFIGASRYANAQADLQGTAPEKLSVLKKSIRSLKELGYFVVPFFHWGYMYQRIPAPREVKIAHACVDYGADLVLGSHAHIFQAHEIYHGKEIWYGLGNFIFHPDVASVLSDKGDLRVLRSFFLQVQIKDGKVISCTPKWYEITKSGVELASKELCYQMEQELKECSQALQEGFFGYRRKYYAQAGRIARQSKKMRCQFQKVSERKFTDKLKIYLDFNFQDLCNRLAALLPWLFKE